MALSMDAILKINAQTSGTDGILQMSRSFNHLGKGIKETETQIHGFAGSIAGLTSVMGALAPVLSIAGIAELGNKAIETGHKLWDMSQKTGVSVEMLSKLGKAAKLNGSDIDEVEKGLVKLSRNMAEAAQTGTGPAADAFRSLGVVLKDTTGKLRDPAQVMLEIGDRLNALPDPGKKAAYAIDIFGKSGANLIPVLNAGSEAINGINTKMSTAFAQKADEYSDRLTNLGGAVSGLGLTVADALLPSLTSLVGYATKSVQVLSSWFNSSKESLIGFLEVIGKSGVHFIPMASAIIGIIGFYKLAKAAQDAWTASTVLFQSLSGPAGWAALAGGATVATIAMVGMYKGVLKAREETQHLKDLLNNFSKDVSTGNSPYAHLQEDMEKAAMTQAEWDTWVQQTEANYRRLQFTVNQTSQAVSGQLKITDARIGAEMAINNAAKTNLQIQLSGAKNDQERLAITQRIADIDIANARLQLELSKAQIQASIQEIGLKIQDAKLSERKAAAELAAAKARGINTAQYEKALQAQSEVVAQAQYEYKVAQEVGKQKQIAAEATYNAAVAQAKASVESERMKGSTQAVANNTAGAANNIRSMAVSMGDAATAATTTADAIRNALNYAAQGKSMVIGLGGVSEAPAGYGAFTAGKNGGISPYAPRLSGFAVGGYVTGPTPALVGEGGEPEYVVPASKMAAASTAYLSGARGPAVLAGSSSAPQVNITTGPVLEFNGEQYVTVADFQRGLQQTAEGVIGRLRTPSARLALGLR